MEPLLHLIIPVLFLMAFFPKLEKKYVFGLAIFAIIMDFDVFFVGWHRVLLNNFLFIILASAIMYYIWDKKAMFVTMFYMCAHLLLDSEYPGGALLYPFSTNLYSLTAEVFRESGQFMLNIGFNVITQAKLVEHIPTAGPQYWIQIDGVLIAILLLVTVVIRYRNEIKSYVSKAA